MLLTFVILYIISLAYCLFMLRADYKDAGKIPADFSIWASIMPLLNTIIAIALIVRHIVKLYK